ncbi:TPA: FAD-dependent thymidylate synthase [bacterium]|nr:FAD-dependent thymidylate synthase [bacterium]
MKVELIRFTEEPELVVALAAKLCYSAADIDRLKEKVDKEEVGRFIDKLLNLGHTSPFEHASFTFGIEGISRVTSHQLVRHRIASYSQQSQRYVKLEGFSYIIPPEISKDEKLKREFEEAMEGLQTLYVRLIENGVSPEDARYVLPGGCETKLMVTMNARELFHFFSLRCCNRAQWEIREMADLMLERVKGVVPYIFKEAGPPCIKGSCPEGKMSCGRPRRSLQ